MNIKQLKKVHAGIMNLIIKSGSDAATVTFRRFNDGSFMVSFYDTDFMHPSKPDTVWTHSTVEDGEVLVERVRAFLFVNAPAVVVETPSYTMEQMFPPFRPRTPETDDEYYG